MSSSLKVATRTNPTTDQKLYRVFVYGTLKKGYGNHEMFLKNSEADGQAVITGLQMRNYACFPACFEAADKGYAVHGEVYEVDELTLARLDRLEGVASGHYYRAIKQCTDGNFAHIYLQSPPEAGERWNRVVGGDWKGGTTATIVVHEGPKDPPPTPNYQSPLALPALPPPAAAAVAIGALGPYVEAAVAVGYKEKANV